MTYKILISEKEIYREQKIQGYRDVGENIFFDDLDRNYQVILFYYPGAIINSKLETQLRKLGAETDKNLLVNIGRLNDPKFKSIVRMFNISKYPVLVMTGVEQLSALDEKNESIFIRIDNDKLLNDPERTLKLVELLFSLYLAGDLKSALKEYRNEIRSDLLKRIGNTIWKGLSGIAGFIDRKEIAVAIAGFKFEIKNA